MKTEHKGLVMSLLSSHVLQFKHPTFYQTQRLILSSTLETDTRQCVCVLSRFIHVWLFVTPWTVAHQALHSWNCPGKNAGVGSYSLLQGIFPTQGLNPGLPHCRQVLYQLSHQGKPRILEWVAYSFSSESSWPRNQTEVSCISGDSSPPELLGKTVKAIVSPFSS